VNDLTQTAQVLEQDLNIWFGLVAALSGIRLKCSTLTAILDGFSWSVGFTELSYLTALYSWVYAQI